MNKRRYHHLGLAAGLPVFLAVSVLFNVDDYFHFNTPGEMNTGHAELACETCHLPQAGTARQQLQAQVSYWLGQRSDWVHFGTAPTSNEVCIACHERPDDRHPVYRFREPRFREARAAIGADRCASCHREHSDARVTQPATFCQTCHEDTQIKNDPLDVKHDELIRSKRWTTCLGCHDFHGNHVYQTPERLTEAASPEAVDQYLSGRRSLYARTKKHPARDPMETPQ